MDNVRQIILYTIITPTEFVRHGEMTQRKCSTSHKENFRHYKIFHGKAEKQAKYHRKCSTYKIILPPFHYFKKAPEAPEILVM